MSTRPHFWNCPSWEGGPCTCVAEAQRLLAQEPLPGPEPPRRLFVLFRDAYRTFWLWLVREQGRRYGVGS